MQITTALYHLTQQLMDCNTGVLLNGMLAISGAGLAITPAISVRVPPTVLGGTEDLAGTLCGLGIQAHGTAAAATPGMVPGVG